jgi:hypothetical protein
VVETNVQDSRRRIWQEAGQRRFGRFAELDTWLLERCRAVWSQIRHPEYGDLTVAEMLAHEQPSSMPMPAPFDGYVETRGHFSQAKVDAHLIRELADLSFTEAAHNVVFIGGSGTGKTHPATALGVSGITQHGRRVRFFSTVDPVNSPEQENAQGAPANWP